MPMPHTTEDHVRTEQQPATLVVSADVQVAADELPRKAVDALRRHVRQHDARREGRQRAVFRLLSLDRGSYHLPQGMLAQLTQILLRHEVPYRVSDQRCDAACARLRSQLNLTTETQTAIRKLLLNDASVLVSPEQATRHAVAAELIARRQQRTLVVTRDALSQGLCEELKQALTLDEANAVVLSDRRAMAGSTLVVASYEEIAERPQTLTQFGFVILDCVASVDALMLMRTIRGVSARYLLGMAEEHIRADGLHGPLYLALGGVGVQVSASGAKRMPRLALRCRPSPFRFEYGGRNQYQAVLAALCEDAGRNELIVSDIVAEVSQGNPCVILSERKDHLDHLYAQLPAEWAQRAAVINSNVSLADRRAFVVRFDAGELDLLFATGQIAADGLALERARRLFVSFPFAYGRKLERVVNCLMGPGHEKSDVIIYDYDDIHVPPLHRACEKRAKTIARLKRAAERDYLAWAQTELDLQ